MWVPAYKGYVMLPVGRQNFEPDEITLNISQKELTEIREAYKDMDKETFENILNRIMKSRQIPTRQLFKKACI